jgi:hypothetical protein
MSEISWPTPYGYTIFCDDIRFEQENKITLVGIYAGEMIFSSPFPVMIPKLGLSVRYFEKPGESSEPVLMEVYFPGDNDDTPTMKAEIPYKEMRERSLTPIEGMDTRLGTGMNTVISPVPLKQEGYIKVRIRRGSDVIRVGSLRITSRAKKTESSETSN